jgi:serine/threonine protein kinase/formylglycine-generating enzyme required for sulfatase activity
MSMPPPEKFEHYDLLKNEDGSVMELGHGSMGVTYKAFDTNLQCNVALKVISAAYLNDATAEERFLREARGAAQLRHRNVASVFHLGRHGESYFYAMEFIEGETVDERVKRDGPLDTLFALEVTSQVASALIAAHKQGLIHRDIKPSNLMLIREDDGEMLVKLIDFGLVKSALIGSTAGALTSGGFVGTPYFASPEQLDQRSEDIRTDIYSLGVTLWFMLTGKPTFMGSVASVIAQHLDKPPEFDSLAVLPGCVVGVLRKMLEKEVEQRIQTPQELRAELKRCLEILKAANAGSPKSLETVSYDEAFETIGLSSTHGLQPKIETGATLGARYRLIEDLDPAHPGRTFHAEDEQQKRRVRVKIVTCTAAAFAGVKERAARLQNASHRNFIGVLAAERAGALGFVVSEWLEGFALVDLLRARRELTLRETLTLLEQIAPTVDAACDLDVRLELQLRDVMLHFPEGFDESNEQVILRCPLAEWPAFVVKLDPLGGLDALDASSDAACGRTMVHASQENCPAVIAQVAALTYDLLGGKPGGFAPLANLSEDGNQAIRQALRSGGDFPTARAFVDALAGSAASEKTMRHTPDASHVPTQPMMPAMSAAAAVASTPRPRPQPAPRLDQERTASPWPPQRTILFAALGVGAILLVAGMLIFSGNKSPVSPPTPGASVNPLANKATTAAPRQPPQIGQPWKNSLDMRYVPVGNIHFATTETRVRDFQAFVDATGYDAEGGMYSLQRDGFKQHGHTWKTPGFPQSPEHPVVGISYEDAKYFCEWLTKKERGEGALAAFQVYRLPTDREWSEAAGLINEPGATPEDRSERVKASIWGSGPLPGNAANFAGAEAAAGAPPGWATIAGYKDAAPRTCIVPGYGPNARGIYDLGGNVWEWCLDRFNRTTTWRVLRGGSWATSRPEELLLSFRRGYDPNFRHDDVGFRCVIASDSGER